MSIRSSSIRSIFLALLVGTVQVLSQSDANPPVVTRCSEWKSDTPLQGVLGTGASQVYAGAGNGTLFSLDSKSLFVKWRVELGGEFVSDSISMDGTVAVVTSTSAGKGEGAESSTLRLLSNETGVVDWSARLGYADRYHLGRSAAGLAAISSKGKFSLFDAVGGQLRKESGDFGPLSTAAVFSDDRALFGTSDRRLYVLSLKSGEILLNTKLEHQATAAAFSQNGNISIGDDRGNLLLLSADEGKLIWRFKSGAAISSIQGTEDGIFLTSLDNFVYRLSNYNGDVIWKRRLTGRVVTGGTFLEGTFAVPVYGENSLFLIDVQKGKVTTVLSPNNYELLNRRPVRTNGVSLILAGQNLVEVYSFGGCGVK